MTRTKDFYLVLLAHALIEIRATAPEGNLEKAPKLADIFHNVPAALRLPWTEEHEEQIHSQMVEKARLYGLADELERWERYALRRTAETVGAPQGPG
jgi:hypothetical protein